MVWSDYDLKEYACVGWVCRYKDKCASTRANMGTERWFCEPCQNDICSQCWPKQAPKQQFAFVALVYGARPEYCVEAAVLGASLRESGTAYPYVLLHTPDVPRAYLDVLAEVGWELTGVPYIDGDALYDGSCNNRFKGVFTKLNGLSLTTYSKIVFLDVDLLVRQNIDSLFERQAPSAMRRSGPGNQPDHSKMPSFIRNDGSLKGGINAGVMALVPSAHEFEHMKADLAKRSKAVRNAVAEEQWLCECVVGGTEGRAGSAAARATWGARLRRPTTSRRSWTPRPPRRVFLPKK